MDPRPEPSFYSIVDPDTGNKREFVQHILVPAQMRQLYSFFKGMDIDWEKLELIQLIDSLLDGPHVSKFISIILREKGKKLQDKNLEELTDFVEYTIDKDNLVTIVKDFFVLNDISSLLKGNLLKGMKETINEVQNKITQPEMSLKK